MQIASSLNLFRPREIMLAVLLLATPSAMAQCWGLRPLDPKAPPPPPMPPNTPCSKQREAAQAAAKGNNPTPGQPSANPGKPGSPVQPVPSASPTSVPLIQVTANGKDVTNNMSSPMSLVAGEPVSILGYCATAKPAAPDAKIDFSVPDAVGGYTATLQNGQVLPTNFTKKPAVIFFPIQSAKEVLKVTCTDSYGRAGSAEVDFDVSRPLLGISAEVGNSALYPFSEATRKEYNVPANELYQFGPLRENKSFVMNVQRDGAHFCAASEDKSGDVMWLQLITKDHRVYKGPPRSLSVIAILAAWRPRQRGSGFVCGYVGMVFDSLSFSVAMV